MPGAITSGIDWTAPTYEEVCARHRWSIPERLNIGVAACDRHAGSRRLALTCVAEDGSTTSHTFDELKDLSDRAATVLADRGVGRGDRVAVFLPQCVETAVAHVAAFKLGAVSVPLSPLFRADALGYRLGHSRAKVVLTDDEHAAHLPPEIGPLALRTEELRRLAARAAPARSAADTSRDDPAMLIYTSGTSGMPKGALHAHRFLPGRLSGFELIHRLESRPSIDRPFWTPADWAWVGGLVDCVLTPWVFGCPVLAWRRRRFDPEATLALIAEHRVRSLFLPPTAVNKLRAVADPRARYALQVESVHCAGEPLLPEAQAWAARAFGEAYDLYGMTEMGATIGNSPFHPVKPGSMGRPYPGHEVALLGEGDRPVGAGEIGEIAIKKGDPGMFLGYFEDPAGTAARFRGEWLCTGDLARRDEDGALWYQGRADDMFNTSGYRVGPTEIEGTLHTHPAVEHAAVVGEPDAERGAVVKAFVVLRPGFAPSEALAEAIQAHVRGRLAAYEYPRRIVFARELPMTVTGKVRRAELRGPGADARYGALKTDGSAGQS
jgi:acetyl-CoA synthetase